MKKKKKIDFNIFFRRILFCVLAVYICYLFVAQQVDISRLNKEEKALDKKIAEAQQINRDLEKEKEAAGTPEYIERVAREKLGYMKPEEKVFIDSKKQ